MLRCLAATTNEMTKIMRAALLILAACSSKSSTPEPSRESGSAIVAAHRDEIASEVIEKAHASSPIDASTSACPSVDADLTVTGTLKVSDFGGKRTFNYVGEAAPARLFLYSSSAPKKLVDTLRARRDQSDFERAYVVEIVADGRAFDGVAGTLTIDVVDKAKVSGTLTDLELRERTEGYAYVENGCTLRVERATFTFAKE